MIPYGKQSISNQDIKTVNKVLKGDYLTTGPMVELLRTNSAKR